MLVMKAAQAKALCPAFRPGSGSKVAECPLWVRRVAFVMRVRHPAYLEHQIFLGPVGTSHLGQHRNEIGRIVGDQDGADRRAGKVLGCPALR